MDFHKMPKVFSDQEMWGARIGDFTFLITKDEEGFSASAKHFTATPFDGTRHNVGKYAEYGSFDEAKAACEAFYKSKQQ